jgi:NAD(P)-dependent dehydrogenase (short-subunit alcohol dehydrogenase family)
MNTNTRVAIVTGGGRGLGRTMVLGLLEHGVSVLAVDRDQAPLDEVAHAASSAKGRLLTLAQDLTAASADQRVEQAAMDAFGQIDILVNNAGMGQSVIWPEHWREPLRFWNIELDQWKQFFELNTHALFMMSRRALPHMMNARWGRIVNVTTSLGSMLRAGFAPYGASKAAAESLSRIMAEELAGTGVTVNVLVPGGLTNTAANPGAPFDRSRMIQPEVMLPPLRWLVSDESAGVTGKRFVAIRWDTSLPAREAAAQCAAPAAWSDEGSIPVEPERST